MIHIQEHESKIKCPADKFFGWFKHEMLDLPNAMSGTYKSIQILEGDGKTVGTVRLWTYVLPEDPNKILTVKELLEEMDDENRRLTMRTLEGSDLLEDYESFVVKLSVTPTSEGGSSLKWVFEFEKKHDQAPHPHTHLDLFALVSTHFDDLLHQAEESI